AFTTPTTPTPIIIGIMLLLGSGMGPSSMTFLVSAQSAVPWKQRGVVTAASQFFRTISGTLGVGALGAVLNTRMAAKLAAIPGANVSPNALLNVQARRALAPETLTATRQALANGLHWVFILLACCALLCYGGVFWLGRNAEAVSAKSEEETA